jgi:hypothetical protein
MTIDAMSQQKDSDYDSGASKALVVIGLRDLGVRRQRAGPIVS